MLQLTKEVVTEAKAVKGKVVEETEELVRFCMMPSYLASCSAVTEHVSGRQKCFKRSSKPLCQAHPFTV